MPTSSSASSAATVLGKVPKPAAKKLKPSGSKAPAAAPSKPSSGGISKPKQKPKKKQPVVVEDPGEDDAADKTKEPRKINETARRKKAKLVGLRKLAEEAGYLTRSQGDPASAMGYDANCCLLTISDTKRLTRFTPVSADKVSFEEGELKKRMMLQEEGGFSTESMRESQVRLDYALKQILNRAAVRCGETNAKTITATTVQSVLRPYTGKTMYTAIVPPLGLVREAQRQAVLGYPEADKNKADAEKELCRESSKAALEKEQALQRKGKDKKGKGK